MSEELEWQLDDWIAEKFMEWKPLDFGDMPIIGWEMKDGKIMTWEPTSFGSFRPSTNPAAFALVKREIERRGWSWSLDYYSTTDDHYQFRLHSVGIEYPDVDIWASSEELAGCLAVKAAMEHLQ